MILNEEELIKRCAKNDRHAQEFLFSQFYSDLYLIAMRYLSDHHDAEDVIIQAFTRVFRGLNKFSYTGQGSLGKWVRTILINESIRLLKKRNLIQFNEDIKHLDFQNSDANGLQQMQASDITRMIEKLPTGYRTVFNLFVVEGYAHKEIAQMLGISANTSKSQLKKARNQLMNNLNGDRAYGTN
jgi:RNA polymerase sigma-70 factor (ECF subfamily)